jgi:hypothetical protein
MNGIGIKSGHRQDPSANSAQVYKGRFRKKPAFAFALSFNSKLSTKNLSLNMSGLSFYASFYLTLYFV